QKSICMFLKNFIYLLSLGIATITTTEKAQPYVSPIGAQVFIEPGQPDQEINTLFKLLSEQQMNCCRISMLENYMKR
ncbi:beta-galactosidase, partial [Capnocytophaga ochracea]|nr:beta-galactosidase [Capnocytophaga ochracea]